MGDERYVQFRDFKSKYPYDPLMLDPLVIDVNVVSDYVMERLIKNGAKVLTKDEALKYIEEKKQ